MKRFSHVIALGVPVLWGCSSDRVTAVPTPAKPRLSVAVPAGGTPLVYDVENTGWAIPRTTYPAFVDLPVNPVLPDPFRPYLGGARDVSLAGWENRRAEFKSSIEQYEIGPKPDGSDVDIAATYTPTSATAGTLRVVVTRKSNGKSLTLTSAVGLPATITGPVPAIIGMNSPTGGLPSSIFTSRNVARITYSHNNVTTYFGKSPNNAYYQMYPEYGATGVTGQYSAWAWGVSRLIDGLQQVASQPNSRLPIDMHHLGVTGCSYAGKMALFSGALDERVALTIAQESGGGGAPSWRVSEAIEPNGSVEKLSNTDGNWFITGMKAQFGGDNGFKLPDDHHELMALVAPRALLVTGNTDFTWLSNRSTYVTSKAVQATYNTLGVPDRFGFYVDGQHNHCAVPASQVPSIEAFVEKFLLGNASANTNVAVFPQTAAFTGIDYKSWTPWAGANPPALQVAMDVQPAQISLGSTAVVNAVVYGASNFDAAAVNAADTRLVTNTGNAVAPIMRGSAANTSLADVNGDGRMDRIIGFSTSALKAAGFGPGATVIRMSSASAPGAWAAFEVKPPAIVP